MTNALMAHLRRTPAGSPDPGPLSLALLRAIPDSAPDFAPPEARRRDRLWELSPNLHCSIIGTCLSTADLRGLLAKLGDPKAKTATEHGLHGQAVGRAARKDEGGKLLHKLLDRRHAREVGRFDRAGSVDEVRALWREAVERGEIPGAYWAVLTHWATDHGLVQEAFGEVHMLSHLVGRSVRADLRRLAALEAEVAAQADTIADQAARIAALTDDKVALARDLAAREALAASPTADPAAEPHHDEERLARLAEQHHRAEAHAAAEAGRRAEAEQALRALAEDVRCGSEREAALRTDLRRLEDALAEWLDESGPEAEGRLDGRTLLYVGGRPRQVAQARLLVARRGGRLLTHDGGLDDNPVLLPGLVAQADAVLFPVDCVSHDAASSLKRACRDHATPFLPLRSASLAALAGVLAGLAEPATP